MNIMEKSNILVIGKLGYHEQNITLPILEELSKQYNIFRIGDTYDFFVPGDRKKLGYSYINSIIDFNSLTGYAAVFFVDYWNPVVPYYNFARSLYNPNLKLIGLLHGSIVMPGDVGELINYSNEYEDFLNSVYDLIITPKQFIIDQINKPNLKLCNFPLEHILEQYNPEYKYYPKILNTHRFDNDKGIYEFMQFGKYIKDNKIPITVDMVGNLSEENIQLLHNYGINYLGYYNDSQLETYFKEGGYAWSSVKSELTAYGMIRLICMGATPIFNNHPAYDFIDDVYKYNNHSDIVTKILSGKLLYTTEKYEKLKLKEKNNLHEINKLIKETICAV